MMEYLVTELRTTKSSYEVLILINIQNGLDLTVFVDETVTKNADSEKEIRQEVDDYLQGYFQAVGAVSRDIEVYIITADIAQLKTELQGCKVQDNVTLDTKYFQSTIH